MPHSAQGLGIDLELDANDHLTALGAVLGGTTLHHKTLDPTTLDTFGAPADFVFGHNILHHDLPWLARHHPGLALLQKPAVDTLYLSALFFAEHPYHALVKDYKLVSDSRNDPVADAQIAARVLADAALRRDELAAENPLFVRILHALAVRGMAALGEPARAGMQVFFAPTPAASSDLDADLQGFLASRTCHGAVASLLPCERQSAESCLDLMFAVAWLRVAGTPDAMSPSIPMAWVRHQRPHFSTLLHRLRDQPCSAADCSWCRTCHDPEPQLQRWFGYPGFRAEPTLADGTPAQRAIVAAGFAERPHLALLPTGGGKSLCFQLPAIVRYLRRGSLSIVISPLQSLMHDQVDNFAQKTRATCAYALTGRLTPPERREALDAVHSGLAGILYVSPEQLRNRSFKKAIAYREIGAWIFDEAHCLSKWGHDFRPDYLYAARFIREFCAAQEIPTAPIVCVTATAKPEVRDEIVAHFQKELGQQLTIFDGHAPRQNLTLHVEPTASTEKIPRLRELVAEQLALTPTGSVLVYAATRSHTESTAALLTTAGIPAVAFHAGLDIPTKKAVQEGFLHGQHPVVCATNAFGMGIDKPDIRLVVHFEIPGSLEAYVQEVGRAGRDNLPARAVLLLDPIDVETQFRLSASSRLDHRDVAAILQRIRHLARQGEEGGDRQAVCTTGEILRDDALAEQIDPYDRGAPTRVVTAIAWLERGRFLRRDENLTAVFQGRPLVTNLAEARQRIAQLDLPANRAAAWLAILARLLNAEQDEGFSSDDLLGLPGVLGVVEKGSADPDGRKVLRILLEMQKAKLLSSGVLMTAFLRRGVAEPSSERLDRAITLEKRILGLLRELEPDPEQHRAYPLSLRQLTQALDLPNGLGATLQVQTLLTTMSDRAQFAGQRAPGLRVQFVSQEHCLVTVRGTWEQIEDGSSRRHRIATRCLECLLERLVEPHGRGANLLASFSLEHLQTAIDHDIHLGGGPSRDPATEIEYALLFLHRIGAIVLHKGLAVFRQAMLLRVPQAEEHRRYHKADFEDLARHQDERTVQIHAMHEFARRMANTPRDGLQFLDEYFRLPRDTFVAKYWKNRQHELKRATSPDSWRSIVQALSPSQRAIVEAGDQESLLVLAGPGSGKTRVVVHRCAYLLRVRRVPARAILVLCYNRSAALELRRRLRDLVGSDAHGVLVQTYHGMAARLVGNPLLDGPRNGQTSASFEAMLKQAVQLLGEASSTSGDADGEELRDRLLVGFRHILVDEYQDIDQDQYDLVSAIAGRTLRDPERKLTVLAVGDDDQNIYEFRKASVAFLRRFETDYQARRMLLVENHRSTAHIVTAAERLIACNQDRLKSDVPSRIDERRQQDPPGGRLARSSHPARGRVHLLAVDALADQPFAVLAELRRLASADPDFTWDRCAILSPRHHLLGAIRTLFEREGIACRRRIDQEQAHSLFRLREVQEFLAKVDADPALELDAGHLLALLDQVRSVRPREPNFVLVEQFLADFAAEFGDAAQPKSQLRDFFGELSLEQRRERSVGSGVVLSTVHGSKGAEYDHVVVLDGGWQRRGQDSWEQLRRLYYVAMTRARQTLALVQSAEHGAPWLREFEGDAFARTRFAMDATQQPLPNLGYELFALSDVNLSYAARSAQHEAIATSIGELCTGDPLSFTTTTNWIFLTDRHGNRVGALSKAATARWREQLPNVESVRVAAVLVRRRGDADEEGLQRLKRDEWLVVVPEVTVRR